MTKAEMMDYIEDYILVGSRSWEDTRDYIIYHIDDFSTILEQHSLTPVEFHCVLPFIKEIFLFAPDHVEDTEKINRAYYAVLDCKEYYAPEMKETPMVNFIEYVFDLIGHKYSSREEMKRMNFNIEMIIYGILMKSKEMLREQSNHGQNG